LQRSDKFESSSRFRKLPVPLNVILRMAAGKLIAKYHNAPEPVVPLVDRKPSSVEHAPPEPTIKIPEPSLGLRRTPEPLSEPVVLEIPKSPRPKNLLELAKGINVCEKPPEKEREIDAGALLHAIKSLHRVDKVGDIGWGGNFTIVNKYSNGTHIDMSSGRRNRCPLDGADVQGQGIAVYDAGKSQLHILTGLHMHMLECHGGELGTLADTGPIAALAKEFDCYRYDFKGLLEFLLNLPRYDSNTTGPSQISDSNVHFAWFLQDPRFGRCRIDRCSICDNIPSEHDLSKYVLWDLDRYRKSRALEEDGLQGFKYTTLVLIIDNPTWHVLITHPNLITRNLHDYECHKLIELAKSLDF